MPIKPNEEWARNFWLEFADRWNDGESEEELEAWAVQQVTEAIARMVLAEAVAWTHDMGYIEEVDIDKVIERLEAK